MTITVTCLIGHLDIFISRKKTEQRLKWTSLMSLFNEAKMRLTFQTFYSVKAGAGNCTAASSAFISFCFSYTGDWRKAAALKTLPPKSFLQA